MIYDILPKSARQVINIAPGAPVFRQGDKTLGMFWVVTGEVQLQRHSKDGVKVIIHRAKSGDTFAEAALFSKAYHCDAVATQSGEVVRFDRQKILDLLKVNQKFSFDLMKQFAIQIQSYRRKLELLAINNAQERVYSALADGLMTTDIKTFAIEIGLTHETVYRALAALAKANKIIKSGRGRYSLRPN